MTQVQVLQVLFSCFDEVIQQYFSSQLPQSFNPKLVLSQLRYSGMLETVKIRRAGFPVRRTYEDFLFRYIFIPSWDVRPFP